MHSFLKKDILILLRDRSELLLLLLMPFILIAILGFALRGLFSGDPEPLQISVAIVQQDNEKAGIEKFLSDQRDQGFSEEVIAELESVAFKVSPYTLLNQVFKDERLREMITIIDMNLEEAELALSSEEIAAILTFPTEFTFLSLKNMLLNDGGGSELQVTVNDYGSLQAKVFQSIIQEFVRALNFETAMTQALSEEGIVIEEWDLRDIELGGIETVTSKDPITSFEYYTFAIAVMFVLYVASTLASKAYVEKQQQVFNRILLSGKHPISYLSGKIISAIIIAFCQLLILFTSSSLLFRPFQDVDVMFWAGILLISAILSIGVGGLTAVLTALTVRFDNETFSSVFSGGIVTIFAFTGGSFIPVANMAEIVSVIGDWTPNGAALSAYLQWKQGFTFDSILPFMGRIIGLSIVLIASSVWIFPRRRSF
ncbi:ABC transporter permease [Evansella sp. AB-rgal1]|uniref:ABC transporter permease n=1 Tax=Evansella sp. AB-rgal1 TaxID=3242696 RepID=UPI00359D67B2